MNRKTTVILLVVFAVLGGIAYYLNTNPEAAGKTPTPTFPVSSLVWELTDRPLIGFRVVDHSAGAAFAAIQDETGNWKVTEPGEGDADPIQMLSATSSLNSLYISRTITETTDMSEFGLLSPLFTVEVTTADGATLRANIGNKTVTGAASYYVLPEDSVFAVLVSATTLDPLLQFPVNPPYSVATETSVAPVLEILPGLATPGAP